MLDFSVTFIITIINITILFLILRAVLFKPVTKLMADRAKRVQDTIDQAEKDRVSARQLADDYETKLKNARAEAEQILKNSKDDAERQVRRIVAEGKEQAASTVAASQKQIEAEHQAAMTKFKLEAAALVMAAASKLAAREITDEDNRRYANMLLSEIPEGISGELAAQKGQP